MRPSNALLSVFTALSRHRCILGAIVLASLLESVYNVYTLRSPSPATGVPLDKPFHVGCQEPDISAPRENATILMLARNADVDGAVKSLTSLEERFNKWYHYPVVFLNDQAWDQGFKDAVTEVASGLVQFGIIEKSMWKYPEWIDLTKARMHMEAQAKAGVIYAGDESYHHMCRFYSGSV
jgi:mannosyltransferase